MKPTEAISLLDQAVSQLSANREVHVKLQQAIEVLKEAITPKGKKEK